MQFYIPSNGDQIRLLENWRTRIYADFRNNDFIEKILGYSKEHKLMEELNIKKYDISRLDRVPIISVYKGSNQYRGPWGCNGDFIIAIIPKGSILTVEKINIRSGNSNLDSITFLAKENNEIGQDFAGSFWTKLKDVNRVKFEKFNSENNQWISSINDLWDDKVDLLEI